MRPEAGVLRAALAPDGISLRAAAGCARGSSWLPAPLLRSGALGFLLRGGRLQKGWDGGRKRLIKVSFLPLPLWPCLVGEGSWPHLFLKDQVEVMAGESPCSLWLVLSDKDRDGLCKYLPSFYSDWFDFSFFFFSAFCKCGWDSRERAGSHPLCCLLSQYKNKG